MVLVQNEMPHKRKVHQVFEKTFNYIGCSHISIEQPYSKCLEVLYHASYIKYNAHFVSKPLFRVYKVPCSVLDGKNCKMNKLLRI